ncbi:MAG TPA: hypothetical protein VEQ15_00285 [Myxococcales bacterium]|nr:hypothetical protein [Myxococcales bacterium]
MPHRHVLAQLLLVGAYLIVINFAVDVATGGFPDVVSIRGVKQAVTGA